MIDTNHRLQTLQIRLPNDLIRRIDTYRYRLPLRPGRAQIIRFLLEHAMNIIEGSKEGNDGQTDDGREEH